MTQSTNRPNWRTRARTWIRNTRTEWRGMTPYTQAQEFLAICVALILAVTGLVLLATLAQPATVTATPAATTQATQPAGITLRGDGNNVIIITGSNDTVTAPTPITSSTPTPTTSTPPLPAQTAPYNSYSTTYLATFCYADPYVDTYHFVAANGLHFDADSVDGGFPLEQDAQYWVTFVPGEARNILQWTRGTGRLTTDCYPQGGDGSGS